MRIVSEDAVRGAVIGGLVEEVVTNGTELLEVLRRGEASRSTIHANRTRVTVYY
jgi:hypothetical protein